LFIKPCDGQSPHASGLEHYGFTVTTTSDWPQDDASLLEYEVVVLQISAIAGAPMLAARLRARARFNRRVLIALVPSAASPLERRAALEGGFDEALSGSCDTRLLLARIVKRLRTRPEYRCTLPPRRQRRPAA
jgi:DNA-binding response OmpR family regulator